MRKIRLILILIFNLAVLPGLCLSATYYVDANNGGDSNPGTSGEPWQTIDRVYTWYSGSGPKVQEGDTVLFRDGDYGEFVEDTGVSQNYLFYRSNWVAYKADTGQTPTFTSIAIDNKDKWGGKGDGDSYLHIEGFDVSGGVRVDDTSFVKIVNCSMSRQPLPYDGEYAPYFSDNAVLIRNASYITIEGCTIHRAFRGIDLEGTTSDIVLSNNEIYDLAGDGIEASGCSNFTMENNYIHNIHALKGPIQINGSYSGLFEVGESVKQSVTNADGILYSSDAGEIYVIQTTITGFAEAGEGGGTITGVNSGATLSGISRVNPTHTDGLQINNGGVSGIVIRGNTIVREGSGGHQAVKITSRDVLLDDIIFENNLIWAPKPMIGNVGDQPTVFTKFNNNTLFAYRESYGWGHGIQLSENDYTIVEMHNNIFACKQSLLAPSSGNNIELADVADWNDIFEDWSNGDFSLAEGSMAIDFGDPNHTTETDILGYYRDSKPVVTAA